MERTKIKGLLNISQKAGALIRGSDNLDGYGQKLYLVLLDAAAGKSTQKIALQLEKRVKVVRIENLNELVGKECKIVGIKNKGLSDEIEKLIEK